jgi:hypothetical protein
MSDYPPRAEESIVLRVPRGSLDAALPPIEFDMKLVTIAEDRLCETEHANVMTAPALSSVFNMASCKASVYSKKVAYELSKAKTLLKRRESDLLIDEWPDFMEEKKLNDSASMREAFLMKDSTYRDLIDRIDLLGAVEALLKEKKEVFIRAYHSMKQLYAAEKRDPTYFQPQGGSNG